jgi:hypothetical protein
MSVVVIRGILILVRGTLIAACGGDADGEVRVARQD